MLAIFILIISIFVLVLIFVKPKLGPILLWPVLFLYPHFLMFRAALIPLNMGMDDLYLCALFLIVLFRRNLLSGVPIKLGYPFWMSVWFFLHVVVSAVTGYAAAGHVEFESFLKDALKGIITVFLAYSLLNTIDDLDDLRKVVFAYSFFAGAGAILIIAEYFYPNTITIFGSPAVYERAWLTGSRIVRPAGAFGNANTAAIVTGVASLVIVSTMGLKSVYYRHSIRFVLLGIMLVAILMTRSRSGFLCLVAPLSLMLILGKNKRYTFVFVIIGLVAFWVLADLRKAFFERFAGTAATTPGFWEPILLRYRAVIEIWETVTIKRLILGQSFRADIILGYLAPHGAYLGIPLRFGIMGVIWAIMLFTILYRRAKIMRLYHEQAIAALGSVIPWCLLAFAMYGVVGGIVEGNLERYTIFLLAVVAQRGVDFIREYEAYESEDIEIGTYEQELVGIGQEYY